MEKDMGFISLHRSMLNWEWYDDINVSRLFIHLLLTVNYQDKTWHGVKVNRGSKITSYEKLAKETRLSIQEIRTALDKLKRTGELTCISTNKFTLVNVVNFNKFQDKDYRINKQLNNQSTNNQQQLNKVNKENNIYIHTPSKKFNNYTENRLPSKEEIKNMKILMKKYGDKL